MNELCCLTGWSVQQDAEGFLQECTGVGYFPCAVGQGRKPPGLGSGIKRMRTGISGCFQATWGNDTAGEGSSSLFFLLFPTFPDTQLGSSWCRMQVPHKMVTAG